MALNPMAQAYIDRGMTAYSETLTDERLTDIEATCTDKHGNIDYVMKQDLMRQEYFGGSAMNLDNQYAELEAKSWEVGDARDYAAGYAHALEFGGDDSELKKYGLEGTTALNTYTDHTWGNEERTGIRDQLAALTGDNAETIKDREKLLAQEAETVDLIKLQQADVAKFGAQYEQITAQMELNKAESELNAAIANGASDDKINELTEAWAEKKVSYFDKYESKEMGNPQNAADAKALQDYNKFIDSLRGDKPAEAETAAPEKTEPAKTEPEAKETVTETKTVETKEYNAKPEPEETGEVKEMTEAEKKAYIEETEKLMEENGGNLRVNSADEAKRAQERMSNYAQYKSDLGIVDENAKPDPYKMSADFKGTQEEWNAQVNKEAAQSVINGDYGNGIERANALKEAGYDAAAVQAVVNTDMAKINAEKQAAEALKTKEQLASGNTEDKPEYPKLIKEAEGEKVYDMGDGSIRTQNYDRNGNLTCLMTEKEGYRKTQIYGIDGKLDDMNIQTFDPETKKLTSDRWIEYEGDGKTKMRERGVSYDGVEVSESYRRMYYEGEMYYEETFKDGQYTISEKNEKGEMITQKYTQEEWDKMSGFDGTQEGFSAGAEGFEAAGRGSERKSLDDQIEDNNEGDMLERKQSGSAAESEYPKLLESGRHSPTGTYKCYDMGDGYVQTQYYGSDGKLDTMVKTNEEKGTEKVQMYDDAGECRQIRDTVYDKETGKVAKETIEERDENGITTSKEIFDGETYRTQTFDKDGNVISDTKETVAERKAREAEQAGFKPKEESETEKPKEQESGKTQGQTPFIPETPSQGQTPFTPETAPKGQGGVETGDETNMYIDTNELPNKGNTNLQINMKRFDVKAYQGSETQGLDGLDVTDG